MSETRLKSASPPLPEGLSRYGQLTVDRLMLDHCHSDVLY